MGLLMLWCRLLFKGYRSGTVGCTRSRYCIVLYLAGIFHFPHIGKGRTNGQTPTKPLPSPEY